MPQRILLAAISLMISVSAFGQEEAPRPTPQPQPSAEAVVTKISDEAQAEYYKVQTQQLKERMARQSFWQRLLDNPSSLGALGAVLAALVALSTFFFNYRTNIRNNRDTQFYECLKRFGDNESATMRCSAAAILADMGSKTPGGRKSRALFGNNNQYFNVAFAQLTRGLLLEENLVCIDAIRTALTKLIPDDPRLAIAELSQANLWLKRDFTMGFAEFWGALQMPPPPHMQDRHWDQAEQWALLDRRVLREFTDKTNSIFWKTYDSYAETHSNLSPDEQKRTSRYELNIRSQRLQANIQLFSRALQLIGSHSREVKLDGVLLVGGFAPSAELSGIGLSRAQLHGFDFEGANLSDANLEGICMRAANLKGARLSQSNLIGANLEDAALQHADLSGARLSQGSINGNTDLTGTKWWQADFYSPASKEVDNDLLRALFERDRNSLPTSSNDLHPSVRTFSEPRNVA